MHLPLIYKIRAILKIVLSPVFLIYVIFGLGGEWRNWNWAPGWAFTGLFLFMMIMLGIPLFKDEKMLKERIDLPFDKDQKPIDKLYIALIIIFYTGWLILMPLDHLRFGWTPEFPWWLATLGGIMFFIGSVMMYHVFTINAFLAPTVKKQENHKVIDTGMYGIVRHPMYTGVTILNFGGALLLSSYLGIAISAALTLVLYARTFHEEALLEHELDGYKSYKKKVRAKLIPWVL